jgi:acetylserotonin N-methyltransferase
VLRNGRHEIADVTRTYLLPQSPHYWGPLLRTLGVVPQQRAALLRALRAPNEEQKATPSAKPELWASDAWARGQMDRAQAETVCRIMHCHSLPASVGMARSGGFERVRHLLDVGGGSGCFAIAIAQHVPSIRCTVMELPAVCEVARGYIDAAGVSHRVNAVAVDMFRDAWPRGHDGVLFSNVFHDWNADTNSGLARRAYETLPRDGRVFVHEMLMADDGSGPVTTASFSMLMLLETQGRQYSFGEVRQTLMHAGFVDITVRQTHGYYSLVSGRRP